MRRAGFIATAVVLAVLLVPTAAAANWVIKGRGFGHGVGMSQYGALGLAKEGRSHKQIVGHYYTRTRIGRTKVRRVRVLINSGLDSIPFSGATRACGAKLNAGGRYSFESAASKVVVRQGKRRIAGCGGEGVAEGGTTVRLEGVGNYRGQLLARNSGGALLAINKLDVESYVRGVVPNEVVTSWPGAALRAQAVAARSYALATRVGGDGFDVYDDSRSQVYEGKAAEVASTNRAVAATHKEVVKHRGEVATTYFFSSSGGRTENSEFGFSGGRRVPYLKSVRDPFDDRSPDHRWAKRLSDSAMESALSGLFAGNLRRVTVLKTGKSPRIVRARVVGSNDSSVVSGTTLQSRLGLRSTWARFDER